MNEMLSLKFSKTLFSFFHRRIIHNHNNTMQNVGRLREKIFLTLADTQTADVRHITRQQFIYRLNSLPKPAKQAFIASQAKNLPHSLAFYLSNHENSRYVLPKHSEIQRQLYSKNTEDAKNIQFSDETEDGDYEALLNGIFNSIHNGNNVSLDFRQFAQIFDDKRLTEADIENIADAFGIETTLAITKTQETETNEIDIDATRISNSKKRKYVRNNSEKAKEMKDIKFLYSFFAISCLYFGYKMRQKANENKARILQEDTEQEMSDIGSEKHTEMVVEKGTVQHNKNPSISDCMLNPRKNRPGKVMEEAFTNTRRKAQCEVVFPKDFVFGEELLGQMKNNDIQASQWQKTRETHERRL